MLRKIRLLLCCAVTGSTLLGFAPAAAGQTFKYQVADLLLTFRKTGGNAGNYEVVSIWARPATM
jgi:hypothetical protein